MYPGVYTPYVDRPVEEPEGFEDEIFDRVIAVPARCQENILMLDEELGLRDPELSFRCGLLNDRYELYAIAIPQCPGHRLVVSLDIARPPVPPAMNHGPVPASGACDAARALVTRHRRLINPAWEPQT
jgi:hypothetical protein